MANTNDTHACTLDKIISLCKRRGFVYQASEIYGGQAGAWDYGPLGVEFKRNIQNEMVRVSECHLANRTL